LHIGHLVPLEQSMDDRCCLTVRGNFKREHPRARCAPVRWHWAGHSKRSVFGVQAFSMHRSYLVLAPAATPDGEHREVVSVRWQHCTNRFPPVAYPA
jgi:hypothetical protein